MTRDLFPRRNVSTNVGKVCSPQDTPVTGLSCVLTSPASAASFPQGEMESSAPGSFLRLPVTQEQQVPPTLSAGLPYNVNEHSEDGQHQD